MKYKLSQTIYTRSGKPMTARWMEKETVIDTETNTEKEEDVSKSINITTGRMLENALLNRNNSDLTEEAVTYNYALFKKIENQDEVNLTKEEVINLKRMLCMLYDTYSAGQALKYINDQK